MASITTRTRRSRKGVKWINHYYSKWFRIRLAFAKMGLCGIYAQGLSKIKIIQNTKATTPEQKINKATAIAAAIVSTHVSVMKYNMKIIGKNHERANIT